MHGIVSNAHPTCSASSPDQGIDTVYEPAASVGGVRFRRKTLACDGSRPAAHRASRRPTRRGFRVLVCERTRRRRIPLGSGVREIRAQRATMICPTVPSDGHPGTSLAFLDGTGETDPAGHGCWKRPVTDEDEARIPVIGIVQGRSGSIRPQQSKRRGHYRFRLGC